MTPGLPSIRGFSNRVTIPGVNMAGNPNKSVYYRKQIALFILVQKIKLWPSRRGLLHGVRSLEIRGDYGEIITHCNKRMMVRDSKKCRAARWLRNKWFSGVCPDCRIPEWKLKKYQSTFFRRRFGSQLLYDQQLDE